MGTRQQAANIAFTAAHAAEKSAWDGVRATQFVSARAHHAATLAYGYAVADAQQATDALWDAQDTHRFGGK